MIKTVFIDLDDTILDFKKSEKLALIKTFNELMLPVSDEICEIYSEINLAQWKRLERGEISRDEVKVNRFRLLFSELGITDASPESTTQIYEENLSHGHYFVDGAEEMLNSIYNKYDLYIASNGAKKVQQGRLATANIMHCFKGHFISEELGCEKPSKAFFDACAAQIPGFDSSTAVIVGDSLTSDILGGKNAGIKTVWFNPNRIENKTRIIPDFEISSLSSLEALLDNM